MWSCRALASATAFQKPQVLIQNQFTRWYRKPRWIPIAKGRVFRIPPRTTCPQEEYEELKRLHNNYRTQMKAVRKQLVSLYLTEMDSLANVKSEKSLREEKLELDRSFALNDEWNKKIAEERELYFERVEQGIEQKVEKIIARKTAIKEHIIKVAEEAVQQEIINSATYITLDKLDEAIENCLNNPVDYNYAIDKEGNYYHGRSTNPENMTLKALDME